MLEIAKYSNAAAPQAWSRDRGFLVFFLIPMGAFWLMTVLGGFKDGLGILAIVYPIYVALAIAYDWIQTRRAGASVWIRRAFLTRDVAQAYGVALTEIEESRLMQVINGTAKAKPGAATEFAVRDDARYLARAEGIHLAIYRDQAGVLARL